VLYEGILSLTITMLEDPLTKLTVLLAFFVGTAFTQVPQTPPSPQQGSTKGARGDAPDPSPGKELPCPQGKKKKEEARFGNYVIRTYRGPEMEGCLQILKSGTVIYSLVSEDFKIGNNFWHGAPIPVGTDITGTGSPNVIVSEWSGGAHCCYTLHVFEIGDKFREIARIQADHGDGSNFEDLNHDGSYEFVGYDWAFAYWRTSFMSSPAPRIVLNYREGRFRLALDLMRTAGPTQEKLAEMIELVRSDREWSPKTNSDCDQDCNVPVALWRDMLDLIYEGHSDMAWKLFDESWPKNLDGKPTFAKQFCGQLRKSRYWRDLKDTVGQCPPKISR